jgi:glyoxylase-like metal-dependent hydrolase (beta-lactamase superfamily II)
MRQKRLQDGSTLPADRTWQKVPGCKNAQIYPFPRKTDAISSNSYLIETGRARLFIDPGGLPDQMEHLTGIIRELIRKKPRPVLTFFTHIHVDHCLRATLFPDFRSDPQ